MAVWLTGSISESNISIPNNTSDTTVNLYANWDGGSWAQDNPAGTVTIDGTNYGFIGNFNAGRTTTGSQLLTTKSKTVAHNADGSKTALCSASFTSGTGSGTVTWSDSKVLTTIARAAMINTFANFNIGSNTVINITNPGGLSVTLDIYDDTTNTLLDSVSGAYATGNISRLLDADTILALIPSATIRLIRAELKTYLSGSQIGATSTKTANAVVSNIYAPVFAAWNYGDVNATTLALTGDSTAFIAGHSAARATVAEADKAAAQGYASMDEYRFSDGATTVTADYAESGDVTIDIAVVTSRSLSVSAVDSRGLSTAIAKTIPTENWLTLTPIVLSEVTVTRDNGVDATVKLNAAGIVHLLNFGAVTNSLVAISYRYKQTDSSTWIDGASAITADVDGSGNITITDAALSGDLGAGGFTTGKSFLVELTLADELTSAALTTTIQGLIVMEYGVDSSGEDPAPFLCLGGLSSVGRGIQSMYGFYDADENDILAFIALKADMSQESWITATLQNGRTSYFPDNFGAVSYMKDTLGFVHLYGISNAGTYRTAIFTLPSGYRPAKNLIVAVVTNHTLGDLYINADGTVVPYIEASGQWTSLHGIIFKAEQ